jgi:hypothetical protein
MMQRQRAAAAMHRAYPGLTWLWAINAARTRWSLPLLPVPEAPLLDRRLAQREARHLQKRRDAYEQNRARGVAVLPPPRWPRSFLRSYNLGVVRPGRAVLGCEGRGGSKV